VGQVLDSIGIVWTTPTPLGSYLAGSWSNRRHHGHRTAGSFKQLGDTVGPTISLLAQALACVMTAGQLG
jgi:hypothetical protein